AMALDAVSEDFVEKHAGGAAGKNGGPDEWIDYRGLEQTYQVLADAVNGGANDFILGKILRIEGFKGMRSGQVHAVFGSGDGGDDDSREAATVLQTVTL